MATPQLLILWQFSALGTSSWIINNFSKQADFDVDNYRASAVSSLNARKKKKCECSAGFVWKASVYLFKGRVYLFSVPVWTVCEAVCCKESIYASGVCDSHWMQQVLGPKAQPCFTCPRQIIPIKHHLRVARLCQAGPHFTTGEAENLAHLLTVLPTYSATGVFCSREPRKFLMHSTTS